MKCSFLTIAILALGCILGGGGRAPAQYSPYSQPSFNPYLNLFRGGGTIGQNYYTLVRPDLNARAGIYGLQQQTQYNQQLITGLQSGYGVNNRFVTTGQPFGFMNHLFFFQNQFRGGLQGGGFGGGGMGGYGGGGMGGFGGGGMGGFGGGLATGSPATFGLGGAGGGNMGGAGARPPGR